jgi:hypothetical protein
MATGRIGATPVLRVRWSKLPTTGTTVLSGLDDNSVALVYDAGYEAVYRNGVLLSRGNDYTATNGTTVTLIDATLAGDVIEIFANDLVPLTDAISKGQFTAKGALLSASAASTPGVVTVGANDTVLTADSSTATGLKWATPAAGGMTLLATVTLSGTTTTVSSINQTYNDLVFVSDGVSWSSGGEIFEVRPNGVSSSGRYSVVDGSSAGSKSAIYPMSEIGSTPNNNDCFYLTINNYTSTKHKPTTFYGGNINAVTSCIGGGRIATTSPITSMTFTTQSVTPTLSGTVLVYGVK